MGQDGEPVPAPRMPPEAPPRCAPPGARRAGIRAREPPRRTMLRDRYRLALLLVIASGLANSLNGLIVRKMDSAEDWQIVFWRSLFLGTSLCIVFVVQYGWRVGAAVRELRPWRWSEAWP